MAILNRSIARAEVRIPAQPWRLAPVLLAAGVLLMVIGLLQLVQTSRATTASFKIQELERQKLELETSVRQLEAEVASLSSLARVEQEAKRLGFGPPQAREVVEVSAPGPTGDGSLPARFLPADEALPAGEQEDTSWWRDLLGLLPFY